MVINDVNNSTTLGTVKMVMLKGERGETGHGALTAATAAAMVDKSQIYVYVGNQSGYTFGNWYFWNGSAWTSGGVYNAVAVSDGVIENKGVLADGTDFDTVTANSVYAIRGDYTFVNCPLTTAAKAGYLLTFKYPGANSNEQILFCRNGNVFQRFNTSGTWSEWNGGIDASLTKQYAAADSKAVGDILYNGTDRTGKTPKVMSAWAYSTFVVGDVTSFSVSDMPRNTFTSCKAGIFSDCPTNIASDHSITIKREAVNISGVVSRIECVDRVTGKMYIADHYEGQTFGIIWREIAYVSELETLSELIALAPKTAGFLSDGADLDNLLSNNLPYLLNPNSIWVLRGDYNYTNAPDKPGYVLTVRAQSNSVDTGLQVFFGRYGNVYSRVKSAGVWSAWNGGIDATLTKQYAAADAKTVGDRFAALEARVAALE